MVQNNKVLTVSYGTFSCTLEGFDDSFETMKAIAEYFRDLSADDRYFGSEPPQPDTEMLARIAKRDASREVEASQNESGLLLRATDQVSTPSQPAPAASELNVVNTPAAAPSPSHPPQTAFADAEPVEDAPAPAADSIAAKLQRIRAVVSHSEENAVIYTEDEETALMKNATGPSDAVAAAFAAGSLDPSDLGETNETEIEQPVDSGSDAQEDIRVEAEDIAEAEPEIEDVVEKSPMVLTSDDAVPETEVEETVTIDAMFSNLDDSAETEPEGEEVDNILKDTSAEDEAEHPRMDDAESGTLTEEDEFDLLSEISEVENHLAGRTDKTPANPMSLDEDVSRLMDKVGEQLSDPTTNTKRETYSHMRAAVAVTEAERGASDGIKQESEGDDYRSDLTSVVSPRRPDVQVTSARPIIDAAAPLKLVAEQRVDNQSEEAGPVTPRRVKSDTEDETPDEGGFVLFAQEQGAQSLPDLLEAAAAYLSFIEGQEQFSRPQLMNKIRSLKQDDFNREESLRSFGQLLRDGKIEKAGGGRFAASTQIGFRPDDERAAG
ncbi:hypothetical protein RUM8411_01261 [Ruegeria meonggei]|uniref:Chemotaxis protein CheA n=2 Tax=Ruegeria meonggei TaxID=1446476 RepID=A0A1X6YU05_9RHOB|nr:hypothetical protein RUM8411_01261 [Ruegeria meonggei]